jgi:glucosamine-6-phosphate deaminase
MRLLVCARPDEVADTAAGLIAAAGPAVLGVATGSTTEATHRLLVERRAVATGTVMMLLDEYLDLPVGHPQRYRSVIERDLVRPLGLRTHQLIGPDVDSLDPHRAAVAYEAEIARRGGVDLQVLGIGRNGHIGFNEPGTPFDSRTRVVALAATTRRDNARFFDAPEHVPQRAITQGIATVLAARSLVLLAVGEAKAAALAALLDGEPTPDLPASALSTHPDLTVVADSAAMSATRALTTASNMMEMR